MIITISGSEGSGKSSVGKLLAKELGYKHYSVGDYRRKLALDMKIDINELNKIGETKDFTDKGPDEWQTKLGKTEDNFIIDGRMSYFFIPNSFKIFLYADEKVRAERVFIDHRKSEKYPNVEETIEELRKRRDSDIRRLKKYYNVDPFDKKNFDLVVDTTQLTVQDSVQLILQSLENQEDME